MKTKLETTEDMASVTQLWHQDLLMFIDELIEEVDTDSQVILLTTIYNYAKNLPFTSEYYINDN